MAKTKIEKGDAPEQWPGQSDNTGLNMQAGLTRSHMWNPDESPAAAHEALHPEQFGKARGES